MILWIIFEFLFWGACAMLENRLSWRAVAIFIAWTVLALALAYLFQSKLLLYCWACTLAGMFMYLMAAAFESWND